MPLNKVAATTVMGHRLPLRLTIAQRPQTAEEVRGTQLALNLLLKEMAAQELGRRKEREKRR